MENPEVHSKSILEEFRTLQKHLGKNEADALMSFMTKYNEILMNNLVTKADFQKEIGELKAEFHKSNANLSWKLAGFIIAQTAVFLVIVKLIF
ncbi:MAG: hypothetical protein RLO12_01620 [Fulvivirga sp.]